MVACYLVLGSQATQFASASHALSRSLSDEVTGAPVRSSHSKFAVHV